MSKKSKKDGESGDVLEVLKARFEKNMHRHKGIDWAKVEAKLKASPAKLKSLAEMEKTAGEPDVVGQDRKTGEFIFFDCAEQTPDRRSLCYDREAWEGRKQHRPTSSAMAMAEEMGVEMLDEAQYQELQKLGDFDTKTSSWLKTPPEVRKLGGAIFGDKRFGRVFIYHNGADSYYGGRAFRGYLRI